jgi:hypothetical protein
MRVVGDATLHIRGRAVMDMQRAAAIGTEARDMRQGLMCFCIVVSALLAPATAALDPATGSTSLGAATRDLDEWQRIDLRYGQPCEGRLRSR